MTRKRIAILVSGSGTNLQAFIDNIQRGTIDAVIAGVLANRPCFGLERAQSAEIPAICLPPNPDETREGYDVRVRTELDRWAPDLVVLAGFMRILSPAFVDHYAGRLVNVHPSLLPRYKGLNTHQRVLDARERWHGTSVHFVTAELDGGPIVAQARLEIAADESAASLSARIQALEHTLYPRVVGWFCQDRLHCLDGQVVIDGERKSEGIFYASPQELAQSGCIS